jgi:hypothetical protein
VGYIPEDQKEFLVEIPDEIKGNNIIYQVINNDGIIIIPATSMGPVHSIWNKNYAIGNITSIHTSGNYQLQILVENKVRAEVTIKVDTEPYKEILLRAVQFYYYERCGTTAEMIVPGYIGHELCHADDGILYPINGVTTWINLSGGWHDAGDYGKYMESHFNTQFAVYALANCYRMNRDYWLNAVNSTYDTPAPDAIDEAIWGAQFLQKMIVPDSNGEARVFSGIYAKKPNGDWNRFGFWGAPSDETDNLNGTGDERSVASLWNTSGDSWAEYHKYGYLFVNDHAAMMVAAALVETALGAKDFTYWNNFKYSPEKLVQNATALFRSHLNGYFLDSNGSNPELLNSSNDDLMLYVPLLAAKALAEWAKYTNDWENFTYYSSIASRLFAKILTTIGPKADPVWWDYNMMLQSLWQYSTFINGTICPELKQLFSDWSLQTWEPTCNETGNIFHFQKHPTYYFDYYGTSLALGLGCMSAMFAWNSSRNPNEGFWSDTETSWIRDYGVANGVHWLFGRNPLDICQIESFGVKNLPVYHNRYCSIPGNPRGAVPGIIPNGIARAPPSKETLKEFNGDEVAALYASPDIPWFDLNPLNLEKRELGHFRSNEVYITDNAGFIMGFSCFLNQSGIF